MSIKLLLPHVQTQNLHNKTLICKMYGLMKHKVYLQAITRAAMIGSSVAAHVDTTTALAAESETAREMISNNVIVLSMRIYQCTPHTAVRGTGLRVPLLCLLLN